MMKWGWLAKYLPTLGTFDSLHQSLLFAQTCPHITWESPQWVFGIWKKLQCLSLNPYVTNLTNLTKGQRVRGTKPKEEFLEVGAGKAPWILFKNVWNQLSAFCHQSACWAGAISANLAPRRSLQVSSQTKTISFTQIEIYSVSIFRCKADLVNSIWCMLCIVYTCDRVSV